MRFRLGIAISGLFVASALAQKSPNIVGKWVAHPSTVAENPPAKDIKLTFGKNGAFSFVGFHTDGKGKYKLKGLILVITLTLRDGKPPTNPKYKSTNGRVSADGKAIWMESGMERNGKPVPLQFKRA